MSDLSELVTNAVNWLSIPLTGVVSVLGLHYKRNLDRLDKLEDEVSQLNTYSALNHQDIEYIKKSCDQMTNKLGQIEEKLNNRQSTNYKG